MTPMSSDIDAFLAELRPVFGSRLRVDRLSRATFRTDAGGLVQGLPSVVAAPSTTDQVSALLRAAQSHRVPVTTRGGGLTSEGETVRHEGVLLDMKAMRRVLSVEPEGPEGPTAWVEAGITFRELAEQLRPLGLDYRSGPLNLATTLGGTLAVGGIDVNSHTLGCTADQVLAAEVVLPDGHVLRCDPSTHAEVFEDVLYGYGQFGVVTRVRLVLKPYRPVRLELLYYGGVRPALRDLETVVAREAADLAAVLGLMGEVTMLLLGFEEEDAHARFRRSLRPRLAGGGELGLAVRIGLRSLARPSLLRQLPYMARRRTVLKACLEDPRFVRDGWLEDRAVVLSRMIWAHWGSHRMVIPDLSVETRYLEEATVRGIQVCRRFFERFTYYCIHVRKFGDRPRYELSCIPRSSAERVAGVEFCPLLEGVDVPEEELQLFKDQIYDIGLDLGGTFYRFGGLMKPYVRKAWGDSLVDRRLARKRALDPSMILNPDTLF